MSEIEFLEEQLQDTIDALEMSFNARRLYQDSRAVELTHQSIVKRRDVLEARLLAARGAGREGQ